ncbi:MAG: DUF3261 domain-containing protein [Magnetococcales bacterium]|nr:DUF3261 domain-containing protein [Magnetococcales bacterium]MBF0114070.1 DUF3261 domain-containing protein [Magnetococcales bacterium]
MPVSHDIFLELPPPSAFAQEVETAQRMLIQWQGKKYALESQLHITPQILHLVITDPLGRRFLTLSWDGKQILEERAPWLPKEVRSTILVAHILLVHAPSEAFSGRLHGGILTDNGKLRTVSTKDHRVMTITYQNTPWNGVIHFLHHELNYELTLEIAD